MPPRGAVVDHRNKVFGRLTFVNRLRKTPEKARVTCTCGRTVVVLVRSLVSGRTRSCGCLRREVAARRKSRRPSLTGLLRTLYGCTTRSAARRGYVFDISFEQFCVLVQTDCRYCGVPPSQVFRTPNGTWDRFRHGGIDRRDNQGGYTFVNCVPCCKTCNVAKQGLTEAGFIAWVGRVYGRFF